MCVDCAFSHSSPGVTLPSSGIRRAKLDLLLHRVHKTQRSRHYGALFGHSASQAGHASSHSTQDTAVPALRCPSRAFREPSWTSFTSQTPLTAVPALRCPSRAFGEPSRTSLHKPHNTAVPDVKWRGQEIMSSQLYTVLFSVLFWLQPVLWGRVGPSGAQALVLLCFIMTSYPSTNRRTPCCLPMYSLSLVSGHCR